MKRICSHRHIIFFPFFMLFFLSTKAQGDTAFIPKGSLWGLGFGDFSFKSVTDKSGRGATNQYTGMPDKQSQFHFRRLYLGYDYEISRRFSSNFLLAFEENNSGSGDLLTNGRLSLFIKNASVTWKNIFKGSNLSLGQVFTPAAVLLPEVVWDYRCIERTISELRRTPAWDMGIILSGTLHDNKTSEWGYNIMIGNGSGSKPENNRFKWFYGDVYAKLFNKKLILDLYADYSRIDWNPLWHHDRNMFKALIAYSSPKFTIGCEAFNNTIRNDVKSYFNNGTDTPGNNIIDSSMRNSKSINWSAFARGKIYKDKLGFFARYDQFDPGRANDNAVFNKLVSATPNYNPNTAESFFTLGLDYTPIDKIHIMPNVWSTRYRHVGPGTNAAGTDLVYRLSIYYVYGK